LIFQGRTRVSNLPPHHVLANSLQGKLVPARGPANFGKTSRMRLDDD
jgi:hypothetical protein